MSPRVQFSPVQSHLFQVQLGPGPLRCPSLTRLPMWKAIPRPLLTTTPVTESAVGSQITSLRSDDLVVPRLPACGCEWWRGLVSSSTGGDWWATYHDESCARYSRLRCDIGVSPLLPLPFTERAASGGDTPMSHQSLLAACEWRRAPLAGSQIPTINLPGATACRAPPGRCPPWTAAEDSVPRDWTGKKEKDVGFFFWLWLCRHTVSPPITAGTRTGGAQ